MIWTWLLFKDLEVLESSFQTQLTFKCCSVLGFREQTISVESPLWPHRCPDIAVSADYITQCTAIVDHYILCQGWTQKHSHTVGNLTKISTWNVILICLDTSINHLTGGLWRKQLTAPEATLNLNIKDL